MNVRASAREINDLDGPGTVNDYVAQNWFRRLKEFETSLKDKAKTWRTSVGEDEGLLEMIEHTQSFIHCWRN